MENDGRPARVGELPIERLTRLSEASLRTNESLDADRGGRRQQQAARPVYESPAGACNYSATVQVSVAASLYTTLSSASS